MKKSFEVLYLQTKHIAVNRNKVSCVKLYINCLVDLSVNLKLIILERNQTACHANFRTAYFAMHSTISGYMVWEI